MGGTARKTKHLQTARGSTSIDQRRMADVRCWCNSTPNCATLQGNAAGAFDEHLRPLTLAMRCCGFHGRGGITYLRRLAMIGRGNGGVEKMPAQSVARGPRTNQRLVTERRHARSDRSIKAAAGQSRIVVRSAAYSGCAGSYVCTTIHHDRSTRDHAQAAANGHQQGKQPLGRTEIAAEQPRCPG